MTPHDNGTRAFRWRDSNTEPPTSDDGLVLVCYPPGMFEEAMGTTMAQWIINCPRDYPYWAPFPPAMWSEKP